MTTKKTKLDAAASPGDLAKHAMEAFRNGEPQGLPAPDPADTETDEGAGVQDDDGETIEVNLLTVTVSPDPMTKVPEEIFEHELPILYRLHGNDNVVIVKERDAEIENFDADREIERLFRKYGKAGENAVAETYGRDGALIAEELGLGYRRQRGARQQFNPDQFLAVDHAEGTSNNGAKDAVVTKKGRESDVDADTSAARASAKAPARSKARTSRK